MVENSNKEAIESRLDSNHLRRQTNQDSGYSFSLNLYVTGKLGKIVMITSEPQTASLE